MSHRALTSFKAYAIRGRIGIDIDEDVAYRVGRAVALELIHHSNRGSQYCPVDYMRFFTNTAS